MSSFRLNNVAGPSNIHGNSAWDHVVVRQRAGTGLLDDQFRGPRGSKRKHSKCYLFGTFSVLAIFQKFPIVPKDKSTGSTSHWGQPGSCFFPDDTAAPLSGSLWVESFPSNNLCRKRDPTRAVSIVSNVSAPQGWLSGLTRQEGPGSRFLVDLQS